MRALVLIVVAGLACAPVREDPAVEAERDSMAATAPEAAPGIQATEGAFQATTLLERHDFARRSARFDLPGRLDEISGLAFTPDGRLFGHDDERGRVHEIDPRTGEVGKRFDLGEELVRADFEGIAIVGDRFFLITSLGMLYEFREGSDRENVQYRMTDTAIGGSCEVEGLDYDATDDALFIACKVSTPDRGAIVVHRLPLDPRRDRLPPLLVPKSQLGAHGLGDEFEPSGIAMDPTGTLVMVSGRQEAIIEVARNGSIIAGLELSNDRHPQSEGVAFGPDGTLYISDEQNGRDARLTVYARAVSGGGTP